MRLFLGIIIGIVITVGGAYIVDSFPPAAAPGDTATETHMVNWDVVQRRLSDFGATVHEGWNRLTGSTAHTGT
jgi:hypothetical protein